VFHGPLNSGPSVSLPPHHAAYGLGNAARSWGFTARVSAGAKILIVPNEKSPTPDKG
jgi:hypothetical protein